MIALPKWLKALAEQQRLMRQNQRKVTSEEARRQVERVATDSAGTRMASKIRSDMQRAKRKTPMTEQEAMDRIVENWREEQKVTAGFKEWWNGHHPDSVRCRQPFDDHKALLAFFAGADWQKKREASEADSVSGS